LTRVQRTLCLCANDFAEFPSQFNEHWATYPSIFKNYAKHYKTGEPMPAELAARIDKAKTFNTGYDMRHVVAAAELDIQWHSLPASAPLENPDTFEKEVLEKIHLWISYVPPRYRSSYFGHIWNGGYAAEYYAYLWTQMLKDDAFDWFVEHGGISRGNGDRARWCFRAATAKTSPRCTRRGAVLRLAFSPCCVTRDWFRREAQSSWATLRCQPLVACSVKSSLIQRPFLADLPGVELDTKRRDKTITTAGHCRKVWQESNQYDFA